jgi:hypothetical protein
VTPSPASGCAAPPRPASGSSVRSARPSWRRRDTRSRILTFSATSIHRAGTRDSRGSERCPRRRQNPRIKTGIEAARRPPSRRTKRILREYESGLPPERARARQRSAQRGAGPTLRLAERHIGTLRGPPRTRPARHITARALARSTEKTAKAPRAPSLARGIFDSLGAILALLVLLAVFLAQPRKPASIRRDLGSD